MNNQSNYNIPKTKKEKAEILQAILRGEKTIEDLKETGYEVTLWKEDETDPNFLKTFDGLKRISKEDYEKSKLTGNSVFVTLDIN